MLEDRGREECIQRHCTDEKHRCQLSLRLYQRKLRTGIKNTTGATSGRICADKHPTRDNGLNG
jgi:hypothetical protein